MYAKKKYGKIVREKSTGTNSGKKKVREKKVREKSPGNPVGHAHTPFGWLPVAMVLALLYYYYSKGKMTSQKKNAGGNDVTEEKTWGGNDVIERKKRGGKWRHFLWIYFRSRDWRHFQSGPLRVAPPHITTTNVALSVPIYYSQVLVFIESVIVKKRGKGICELMMVSMDSRNISAF